MTGFPLKYRVEPEDCVLRISMLPAQRHTQREHRFCCGNKSAKWAITDNNCSRQSKKGGAWFGLQLSWRVSQRAGLGARSWMGTISLAGIGIAPMKRGAPKEERWGPHRPYYALHIPGLKMSVSSSSSFLPPLSSWHDNSPRKVKNLVVHLKAFRIRKMPLQARRHLNKVIDSSSGSVEALVEWTCCSTLQFPPASATECPPGRSTGMRLS